MKHFFAGYILGVCGSVKGPVQSMDLPMIDFFGWNVFKNQLCANNPVKLILGQYSTILLKM